MAFRPEGWNQIDPSFKNSDGQFVGAAIYGLSYAYNTNSVAKAQVPKSAMDFPKPELRGKAITSYPNDDEITAIYFILSCRNMVGILWTDTRPTARSGSAGTSASPARSAAGKGAHVRHEGQCLTGLDEKRSAYRYRYFDC